MYGNIMDFALENDGAAVVAVEINADDVVNAVSDMADLAGMAVEHDQMIGAVHAATADMVTLENEVALESGFIAGGEVPASVTAMALTSLEVSAGKMGLSLEGFGIALESAMQTPKTGLKTAVEAKKGMIEKIKNTIVAVLRKASAILKKFVAKAASYMNRAKSTSKSLADKLEKIQEENIEVSKAKFDSEEAVNSKFAAVQAIFGVIKGTLPSGFVSDVKGMNDGATTIEASGEEILKAIVAMEESEKIADLQKATIDLEKMTSNMSSFGKIKGADIAKTFEFSKAEAGKIDGDSAVSPLTFTGKNVLVAGNIVTADDKKKVTEAMAAVAAGSKDEDVKLGQKAVSAIFRKAAIKKMNIKEDAYNKLKPEVLSVKGCEEALSLVDSLVEGQEDFVKNRMKENDQLAKDMNALDKMSDTSVGYANVASRLLSMRSSVALASVFGYLGSMNDVNWLVAQSLSAYKETIKKD